MRKKVPKREKAERSKMLHILSEKKQRNFYNQFINSTRKVLFEGTKNGYSIGHTDNYIKVQLKDSSDYRNQILDVKLNENRSSYILGRL